ncbi:hypothetical protein PLESTM_000248700 [Pleodorina starrii]|nr:hypothetical protein PLESTM_000248700 [Pleodorina starrii]
MATGTLRVLSFRTSAGETVRAHDCICWRHLEGRPCRTAQERQLAQAFDAVIIPVISSGHGGASKRARKAPSGRLPATGAANSAAAQDVVDLNVQGDGRGGATHDFVDREGLLACCAAAQAALQASGLRANVDDCPRQTPGAKYHAWENRGVGLRIEVGSREAASGTFCLALHPSLAHLMPAAAAAAAAVELPAQASAAGAVPEGSLGPHPAPADLRAAATEGGRSGGRAGLRLGGFSPQQLVAACRAVVAQTQAQTRDQYQATAGSDSIRTTGGAPGGSVAPAADPAAATAAAAATGVSPQWCRKLHLWPHLVEAWGSTQSSVATLLAQLAAAQAGGGGGGGGGGGCGGGGSAPSAVAVAGGGRNDVHAAAPPGGGDRPGAGGTGNGDGAGDPPTGQRPCVAHLRHLLQLGRPCYCGRGHYSLQQLQEEVGRCYRESGSGSGAGLQQQQQQQIQQSAAVLEWIAPPQPKNRQQQRQRQQCQQRQEVGGSRGGGKILAAAAATKVEATAGAAADEEEAEEELGAGDSDVDGRTVTDDGDSDGGGGGSGNGGGGRVVLLVGNIPSAVRASVVQAELAAAFAPYGCCGVAVSRTRNGGSHGWARVALGESTAEATAAAAAEAVAALDGRLRLGGTPLTVSYSSGRLDTIFPYLPYVVRCAMRVDSTAAFSATDQATADKMTDLLAGLAERLILPPPPPPETAGRVLSAPQQPRPLLPLVLTDGTACCGGNALSYARRFERVVAVELDPDRAEDLRHNAALVRAWDDFRRAGSRAGLAGGTDAATAAAANGDSTAGGSSGPPEGGLGALEVMCGDYTRLTRSLRQDVVFMDPPWGGPQYCGAAVSGPAGDRHASGGGATAAGSPSAAAATSGGGRSTGAVGGAMEYGDAAFMLGQVPLSYMVSELLAGGAAGMVALKLPSRADAELRAMQARVRQLVAARLRGMGAAAAEAEVAEVGGGGSSPYHTHTCRRRLLGAEVTLGRSALVVFMLLPYKYGSRTPAGAGGTLRACGEGDGPVAADAGAVAADAGGGGEGRGSEGAEGGSPGGAGRAIGAAGAATRPGDLDSDEEEDGNGDDDTDSDEAEGRQGVGGGCGGGGPGARAGRPRRAAAAGSCTARVGLGAAFRAALRDWCSRLGLPYRLVCD